ncbi:hypothetical protein ETAA8_24620 [Anatilimnocola aggregata]|uniref:Uncharacterized protein n=1 Tax=Anatilimnocola aggregata TaxID=2528021 RepID=A0A517YAW4_9BACT|nr:hypothetical protein [Anatilimnocola aggregata]QDU27375.1 hypothetical protein ETAA8_24620 [Anatilimnocola aggregata]
MAAKKSKRIRPDAPAPPSNGVLESGQPLKLRIAPVIAAAEGVSQRVQRDLPTHQGLAGAAANVARAAREAERASKEIQRPWSLHRLPAIFLAVALILLLGWTYWRFVHTTKLTIALPDRDFSQLQERLRGRSKVSFTPVVVPGSREAAEKVARGEVDLAFVQGGIAIPPELPRVETPSPETVLWLLKEHIQNPRDVKKVLTSLAGEGSHTVAMQFFALWQMNKQIEWLHDWRELSVNEDYRLPDDVDAAFVVKDPADEKTIVAIERLTKAGFKLQAVDLGARAGKLDYLHSTTLPARHFDFSPAVPAEAIPTYSVSTFLVARSALTPRLLAEANHLLDFHPQTISDGGFEPNMNDASEIFQGVEAFLGIIVNIGLAFLALLGLEIMAYRKRFHELNSLISLISMLQSNKDVLGLADPASRKENLLYLGLCSDLLGQISMISGYYTQENSSLLFNNLSEVIHQRCDGLKINIQLKILHALLPVNS